MKNQKKFTEAINEIYPSIIVRYSIKREMDILNECIQFADNTRDDEFQSSILDEILHCNEEILNLIKHYESNNKTDSMESSN